MVAYDSTAPYDDPAGVGLYDGLALGAIATLLVNGADRTAYLQRGTLAVRAATHGNSLGTLDAKLTDPPALPDTEQPVDLYIGTARRYRGTVRATSIQEHRGDHVFAQLSAQDEGPAGGLPTAAPWGLSDTPNGTTTHGYARLTRDTRTTEGGSPQVSYVAVVREVGLWPGQNVEVTSAVYGLAAEEFTIKEVQLRWSSAGIPEHTLTLGDPLVSLAQVLAELEANIAPGSITATEISDGAVSTPKLAANAVTAAAIAAGAITAEAIAAGSITSAKFATDAEAPELRNSTGRVVIDAGGVTITDGALVIRNESGAVIIDGTSSIFHIAATGTLTKNQAAGGTGTATATLSAITVSTTPAIIAHVANSSSATADANPVYFGTHALSWVAASSGGATVQRGATTGVHGWMYNHVTGGNPQPTLIVNNTGNASALQLWGRYYVLAEAAL